MNKKIIISLSVIGAIAAIAVGGTIAYFSDTETSTGNTFTAGTLDLKLDAGDINVTKFVVTNANPGQSGWGTWDVNNSGNLPGYLDFQNITVTDDDMGCNEPEAAVPDATCGDPASGLGGGDLSQNLDVQLCVDTNDNGICEVGEAMIYSGPLSGIASDYDYNLSLAVGETKSITMTWKVSVDVGNIIQSDKTTLGIAFELGQTAGQ